MHSATVSASARGMMGASILQSLCHEDREAFTDIYDRRGYIVQGVSLSELRCKTVAAVVCDLAEAIEAEMKARAESQPENVKSFKPERVSNE